MTCQQHNNLHSLCFISNENKQRFLPLVEFLKILSNTTSLFRNVKQHQQNIKQQKTSQISVKLSNERP